MIENHNQNGLKDFYVIRESGECVFHKSYIKDFDRLDADQTIVSSFLSAINTFSTNVDLGAKMLETHRSKFVYHKNGQWLFVARTEKSVNSDLISNKLDKISTQVNNWLPSQWDGNVGVFQGVTTLIKEQFINSNNVYYEITGKSIEDLSDVQEKVYSFLRFKGRSTITTIAKLMRIPEQDAEDVTMNLLNHHYLTTCQ